MKIIKFSETEKYNVPETWSELPLCKFMELSFIKEDTDEVDKILKIAIALTGISEEKLLNLPYTEFTKIQSACQFVFTEDNTKDIQYIIEIDNCKYGFDYDIAKMTTSEYFDIDHYVKNGNTIVNLNEIMAILYREVNNVDKSKQEPFNYTIVNYESDKTEHRAKLFYEKMPASAAIAAQFFFLMVGISCIESMKGFFQNETSKKTKNPRKSRKAKASKNDGAGSSPSTNSAETTLE